MRSQELKNRLLHWTLNHSGIEHREYLGMSQIGRCPRRLYRDLIYGREFDTRTHLACYQGYLFERDILSRLAGIDGELLGPGRGFSDFDGRFQGHTDGEWDGDLLEIKSSTADRMPRRQVPPTVYWQVQCYMHYGGYEEAKIIYVARDTGDLAVIYVPRHHRTGNLARAKAELILEAVERREPPPCECGRCE